jgi:hypothetical protein
MAALEKEYADGRAADKEDGSASVNQSILVIPRPTAEDSFRSSSPVELDLKTLQSKFNMRLSDAAKSLGISPTSLKQVCRKLGVVRWPRRLQPRTGALQDRTHRREQLKRKPDNALDEDVGSRANDTRKPVLKTDFASPFTSVCCPSDLSAVVSTASLSSIACASRAAELLPRSSVCGSVDQTAIAHHWFQAAASSASLAHGRAFPFCDEQPSAKRSRGDNPAVFIGANDSAASATTLAPSESMRMQHQSSSGLLLDITTSSRPSPMPTTPLLNPGLSLPVHGACGGVRLGSIQAGSLSAQIMATQLQLARLRNMRQQTSPTPLMTSPGAHHHTANPLDPADSTQLGSSGLSTHYSTSPRNGNRHF